MPAAGLVGFPQVQDDLAVTVDAAASQPVVPDQAQQALVFALTNTDAVAQPGLVAAPVPSNWADAAAAAGAASSRSACC